VSPSVELRRVRVATGEEADRHGGLLQRLQSSGSAARRGSCSSLRLSAPAAARDTGDGAKGSPDPPLEQRPLQTFPILAGCRLTAAILSIVACISKYTLLKCREGEIVPSANYDLFEQAMRTRKQIVCLYGGHLRELCPIILGHSQGQEKALSYQLGGTSNSGLPRTGEWRCLFLSKVSNAQLRDGPWRVGPSHTMPQHCVQIVEFDVNPTSPYHPTRHVGASRPQRGTSVRRPKSVLHVATGRTPWREHA
jgi:hypothetical protein